MSRHRRRHRVRPHIRRRTAPGSSPGSIVVDPAANKPRIQVMGYGPDSFVERTVDNVTELRESRGRHPVLWVNVDGLGDVSTIERLGELFQLHRLALEDVVNTHQRAKVDVFDNCLFVVARMVDTHGQAVIEQLSMFIGRDFVITFQELAGDGWEPVRKRIREKIGRIRGAGPDYLAYALLDAAIDDYFPVLERVGERLDETEDTVVVSPNRRVLDDLHAIKGELLMLRRSIWPHREMLASLTRESTPFIADATRIYLRDCYDHVIQITDLLETYRELAADLRDLYMSAVSNRINETMRVLTIIATIFIPCTFIASIYGMNFDSASSPWNMPELRWRWGYPLALALMFATVVAMWIYFRRQGWLEPVERFDPKQKDVG